MDKLRKSLAFLQNSVQETEKRREELLLEEKNLTMLYNEKQQLLYETKKELEEIEKAIYEENLAYNQRMAAFAEEMNFKSEQLKLLRKEWSNLRKEIAKQPSKININMNQQSQTFPRKGNHACLIDTQKGKKKSNSLGRHFSKIFQAKKAPHREGNRVVP